MAVDAFVPRLLFSFEVGREAEEAEVAYLEGFLADAGLSKNEVSVVLQKVVSQSQQTNGGVANRKDASGSCSAAASGSARPLLFSSGVGVAEHGIKIVSRYVRAAKPT